MSKGVSSDVVLTSAHAAVALVAACRRVGLKATDAFQSNTKASRARRIAAAGCVSRLGVSACEAGRLFHVQPIRLAPTKLNAAGITTEDLLVVAEALEENGLTAGDNPAARFRAPHPRPPKETAPVRTPRPAVPRPRVVAVASVATPAPARTPAGPVSALPVSQGPRITASPPFSRRPAPKGPFRPVAGLKPITDRIVRWTLQQVRLGVEVDLMADLFDVDADLLQQRIAPGMAAAA